MAPSVLMIGSEAAPFAKTGGLADVLGALPAAISRLVWTVTVALPRYRGITAGRNVESFRVAVGSYSAQIEFYVEPVAAGVQAWFCERDELFDRKALSGIGNADYPDNALRFAVLVRASLEFAGRQT